MKKKIAITLLLVMSLMLTAGCSYAVYADDAYVSADVQPVMPYYGDSYDDYEDYYDSDYYYPEDYDEYYGYDDDIIEDSYYGENTWQDTFGFVLIILMGYILPLAMIIISLIAYARSNSKRRASWFIMTGVGLMTAVLATLYMLLTM